MRDRVEINRVLAAMVADVGAMRDLDTWSAAISRKMGQVGAARVGDLTVSQLRRIVAEEEEALCAQDALADMTPGEYRALDLAEFARVNLAAWIADPGVLGRVFEAAYPELVRKHLASLDLADKDRAKVLLTTLKSCCNRIVPAAIEEGMQRAH